MTHEPIADRVVDATGSTFAERAGDALRPLVDALTTPLADVDDLVQPTDAGVPAVWDVDTTPQPAWLGQATGTAVPPELSLEAQRALVSGRPGLRRGTPGAIRSAVAARLLGTQRVELVERVGGHPWRLQVLTYAAETPVGVDVNAAAAEQTPVGVRLVPPGVLDGATYDHLAAAHGTYADVAAGFTAYDAPGVDAATLTNHVPEPGTEA